jgi:N-acetylglucosamine-6-phosphate deacetylase
MTTPHSISGSLTSLVLTPGGWVRGELRWHEGRFERVCGEPVGDSVSDGAEVVLPGFVDLHVHGGGGADAMDGGTAMATVAGTHARFGTTSLLATTLTSTPADLERAFSYIAPLVRWRPPGTARVLGVHLEGPFIDPCRLGAQPAFTREGDLNEVLRLNALAPIRVVTLAPERVRDLSLVASLVRLGIRVQIGHSDASFEDVERAIAGGASGFTHLFNAMSPLHQRSPGVVGAALALAQHAEIIPDLVHVHPGAIRSALRAIPGLYAVSDATAGAGMPDGNYRLGPQNVYKCLGAMRLADGTLAGSALTMDQALRNLLAIGLSLRDASARLAAIPAGYLGLRDRGVIEPGASADLVVLDSARQVPPRHHRGRRRCHLK